jgi:NAD+ diphosphatase
MSEPAGPLLSRGSFDRAADRRTDQAWLADAWQRASVLQLTPSSATLADDSDPPRIALRPAGEVPADATRRFLGLVEDVPHFAVTVDADESAGRWLTLREVGATLDDLTAGLFTTAVALEQWHQRHPHCPLCGAVTAEAQAGWTRTCPNDGSQHFPRTDPAVIMLVSDGHRALLGRGHQWPERRFSTLAGFVEPGESIEAAVAREVFEEVGVRVRDIRYVASQPWPFPSSLMLGFSARLDGDPTITIEPDEIAEAGWFTRDEVRRVADWVDNGTRPDDVDGERIVGIPPQLSISRYLIDRWLEGKID